MKTIVDPAQGTYKFKEDKNGDYVWGTRTTPVKQYVDDVMFLVQQGSDSNGTCHVVGKSRSQVTSLYDYETNFCNLYNVLRSTGIGFSKPTLPNCPWVPKDTLIEVRCSQY